MIKFRRPKKRTKKALKASDITLPEQETEQERRMRYFYLIALTFHRIGV
jgi:hypothetical protein